MLRKNVLLIGKILLAISMGLLGLVALAVIGEYLLFCGLLNGPTCRPESEQFKAEPEIVNGIKPYLADWVSLPSAETEKQRLEVGQKLGVTIDVSEWTSPAGKTVRSVYIPIERWHEWTRGIIYISDDDELDREWYKLKKIDEHLYVFNSTY